MSITELDKVDAMGIGKEESDLKLMISDHLDWENEEEHLLLLQEKINAYYQFIKEKQYINKYGDEFEKYVIIINFQEKVTEKCMEFLNVISDMLLPEKIYIEPHFG